MSLREKQNDTVLRGHGIRLTGVGGLQCTENMGERMVARYLGDTVFWGPILGGFTELCSFAIMLFWNLFLKSANFNRNYHDEGVS